MARPAKMQIDLAALRHNCTVVSKIAPNSNIVAVIKANAYGHGAVEIAEALQGYISMLAVSSAEEAMRLRSNDIKTRILLLEGCFEDSELICASLNNLDVVFHCRNQIEALKNKNLVNPINAWLKVNTGMHRLGIDVGEAIECYQQLLDNPNVNPNIVLMTHIASADELDNEYTKTQLATFKTLHKQLESQFNRKVETSIGNSATIIGWESGASDWIRPGIMLYGLSPFTHALPIDDELEPVMTLRSEVIAIHDIPVGSRVGYGSTWEALRPSRVATVAIGYGDGYPCKAANGTPVVIKGKRAPVAGRISMDLLTIDVTDVPDVDIGEEVILWGKTLTANEVAKWAGTIGYELVTRMPLRVPKRYC
ncbi:alanine racemase [Alteromonas sp. a30]|uniref:alanine racemase n=1 Tax=Alteromonas sp. a30 TaxID=2730917 RepID=UPI00227F2D69|nr:alanine racemase [Alteromonas sp. a30]MCY7296349.1 alanine racemase [Alteromonas sp. a30]